MQFKSEKLEAQDIADAGLDVHPTEMRKITRHLLVQAVSLVRSDATAEQSPCRSKGTVSTEIKALKEAHATGVRALKKEQQTAVKGAVFEERRMHHDDLGALNEAFEEARKTAPQWTFHCGPSGRFTPHRASQPREGAGDGAPRPLCPGTELG